MNEFYNAMQAWFRYITNPWWVRGIGMIAIFWILMQILDNKWAGGKLFDRKYAWISTMIASILVFFIFVLPWVTWQLLLGILGTLALIGLTVWAKKSWK